ncbi:MAG: hypothetical protein LGB54_02115, partial [Sulfurovum sp.]|nr:hypothetical protein [Sulfurovum sp.]
CDIMKKYIGLFLLLFVFSVSLTEYVEAGDLFVDTSVECKIKSSAECEKNGEDTTVDLFSPPFFVYTFWRTDTLVKSLTLHDYGIVRISPFKPPRA